MKAGRFHGDARGRIDYNANTGRARLRWAIWADYGGDYEAGWRNISSDILGARVGLGSDDRGPRLYPSQTFRNVDKALRRYHKVMAIVDLIAFDVADHKRAEQDDWRRVR
jgi:hypothetical protein